VVPKIGRISVTKENKMSTTYIITLANGETQEVILTMSQPSYYAQEYAYKLAKMKLTEVLTVVQK
jgi:hypothetical protein